MEPITVDLRPDAPRAGGRVHRVPAGSRMKARGAVIMLPVRIRSSYTNIPQKLRRLVHRVNPPRREERQIRQLARSVDCMRTKKSRRFADAGRRRACRNSMTGKERLQIARMESLFGFTQWPDYCRCHAKNIYRCTLPNCRRVLILSAVDGTQSVCRQVLNLSADRYLTADRYSHAAPTGLRGAFAVISKKCALPFNEARTSLSRSRLENCCNSR